MTYVKNYLVFINHFNYYIYIKKKSLKIIWCRKRCRKTKTARVYPLTTELTYSARYFLFPRPAGIDVSIQISIAEIFAYFNLLN